MSSSNPRGSTPRSSLRSSPGLQIIGVGAAVTDAHSVREGGLSVQSIHDNVRKLDEPLSELARSRDFVAASDEH